MHVPAIFVSAWAAGIKRFTRLLDESLQNRGGRCQAGAFNERLDGSLEELQDHLEVWLAHINAERHH